MPHKEVEEPKLDLSAPGIVESLIEQGRMPYITRLRTAIAGEGEQLRHIAIVPSVYIGPDDRVVYAHGTDYEIFSADGVRKGKTERYLLTEEQSAQIRERIVAATQNS